MLIKTGIPTEMDLQTVLPPREIMDQGPIAIIECFQPIPCDPCYWSCRRRAIKEFAHITALPQLIPEKCNGCSLCVVACPGLAIFIVDYSYGEKEAMIRIPYEYLPVPTVGSKVTALNRQGQAVGTVQVNRVQELKGWEATKILWLVVPKELSMEIRSISIGGGENAN